MPILNVEGWRAIGAMLTWSAMMNRKSVQKGGKWFFFEDQGFQGESSRQYS